MGKLREELIVMVMELMKMIITKEMVLMKEELEKWRDYRRKLTRLRGLMW